MFSEEIENMKIHVVLMSLLCMTTGILYAAQVAGPASQPGFFQQQSDAIRQYIAEMIPNDDDLDKLVLAYPNDPILLQEQHNRLDLLKYWTRQNIKLRTMPHGNPGYSPAFSPDGNYLAFISTVGDKTLLTLLFVPTGYAIPIPKELEGARDFAFSPDTNIIAVVVKDCVKLWDLRTNQVNQLDPLCSKEKNKATLVAFSPDGILAVGHQKEIISLWDIENHSELPPIELQSLKPPFGLPHYFQEISISNVAFSHDGKQLAAVLNSNLASYGAIIWDVQKRKEIELPTGFTTGTLRLKCASRAGVIALSRVDKFESWSIEKDVTPIELRLLWDKDRPEYTVINDIALSPDGKVLATGHRNGKIMLWNAQNGDFLTILKVGQSHFTMTFSPNGKNLAVISSTLKLVSNYFMRKNSRYYLLFREQIFRESEIKIHRCFERINGYL